MAEPGPDYHQCEDPRQRSASLNHPQLSALGGIGLIFGILASAVWAVIVLITDNLTWWVVAPIAAGVGLFVGTALLAFVLDEIRKAKRE